jgi:hypothetical protein
VCLQDTKHSVEGALDVLFVSLLSALPPLYAIIGLLIRPVQPIQWIVDILIRPGTHHQHLKNHVSPVRTSVFRRRKERVIIPIVFLFRSTQSHDEEKSKHEKDR